MTDNALTLDVINELDMNYAPWGADKTVTDTETGTVWEYIDSTDQGYDEGTVTTQLVWCNNTTQELWAFEYDSNSWSEYYETYEPYRVEAGQKTITVYNKV